MKINKLKYSVLTTALLIGCFVVNAQYVPTFNGIRFLPSGDTLSRAYLSADKDTLITGDNDTIIFSQQANETQYYCAGAEDGMTITNNLDGTVTVDTTTVWLYKNADFTGFVGRYVIPEETFTLTPRTTNYIIANYNSGSPVMQITTDVDVIDEGIVIPLFTVATDGTNYRYLSWAGLHDGLPNKQHLKDVKVNRFQKENGLLLLDSVSNYFSVSAGSIWYGVKKLDYPYYSSYRDTVSQFYKSAGTWTREDLPTYNNLYYNDGTDRAELLPNRYAVSWVYKINSESDSTAMGILYGTGNYTLTGAQESTPPSSKPYVLEDFGYLIARIICKKNATTATQITLYSGEVVVAAGAAVAEHNDLQGIQGGATDEYYHMTEDEYNNNVYESDLGWTLDGDSVTTDKLVGIGTTTPTEALDVDGDVTISDSLSVGCNDKTGALSVCGNGVIATFTRSKNGSGGAANRLIKTRGSVEAPTTIQDGDILGSIQFWGLNSDDIDLGSEIKSNSISVLSPSGTFDISADLEFNTTDYTGSHDTRMYIDSVGNVGIGTETPTEALDVNGNVKGDTIKFTNGSELHDIAVLNDSTIRINDSTLVISGGGGGGSGLNNYLTGVDFNTSTGLWTYTRDGLGNLTENSDGRYLLISDTTVLSAQIYENADSITAHRTDINSNTAAIASNLTLINSNATSISNNTAAINSNFTLIGINATDVNDNSDSITAHRTDLNTLLNAGYITDAYWTKSGDDIYYTAGDVKVDSLVFDGGGDKLAYFEIINDTTFKLNNNTFTTSAGDVSVDNYVNGGSFNAGTGLVTLTGTGSAGASYNLDGRYLLISDTTGISTQIYKNADSITTHRTAINNLLNAGYLTSETDPVYLAQKSTLQKYTDTSATDATRYWVASQNYISGYSETDPIWTADKPDYYTAVQVENLPVSTFTNDAGYIIGYTETDPFYTASSWYTTTNNATNWDVAYGWGDHDTVGYLLWADTSNNLATDYDLTQLPTGKFTQSNDTISPASGISSIYFETTDFTGDTVFAEMRGTAISHKRLNSENNTSILDGYISLTRNEGYYGAYDAPSIQFGTGTYRATGQKIFEIKNTFAANLNFYAAENWSASNFGTGFKIQTSKIGTATPTTAFEIDGNQDATFVDNVKLDSLEFNGGGDKLAYFEIINDTTFKLNNNTFTTSAGDVSVDNYVNGSTFTSGTLTLTGTGAAGTNVSIDGRYAYFSLTDSVANNIDSIVAHRTAINSLLNAGYLTTETDPVWTADKSDYYTSAEVDALDISTFNNDAGYLTNYTETDPVYLAQKPTLQKYTDTTVTDATRHWVRSQGYLSSFSETDPVWTADKPDYYTATQVNALDISTFNNNVGYITGYTETDPIFATDSAYIAYLVDLGWSVDGDTTNTNNRVGIGVEAPSEMLDVDGNVKLDTVKLTNGTELWDITVVNDTTIRINDESVVFSGGGGGSGLNNYVDGISFDTSTGDLVLTREGMGNLTQDLDGRYLLISDTTDLSAQIYKNADSIADHRTAINSLINAGYITAETDPVYSADPAFGITSTNITNWNTAYSWGDHDTVGYATQTYVSNNFDDYDSWDLWYSADKASYNSITSGDNVYLHDGYGLNKTAQTQSNASYTWADIQFSLDSSAVRALFYGQIETDTIRSYSNDTPLIIEGNGTGIVRIEDSALLTGTLEIENNKPIYWDNTTIAYIKSFDTGADEGLQMYGDDYILLKTEAGDLRIDGGEIIAYDTDLKLSTDLSDGTVSILNNVELRKGVTHNVTSAQGSYTILASDYYIQHPTTATGNGSFTLPSSPVTGTTFHITNENSTYSIKIAGDFRGAVTDITMSASSGASDTKSVQIWYTGNHYEYKGTL